MLPMSVQDIARVRFSEDVYRVQGLRADSLSLFMHHANLQAERDVLLFDNTKGIVLASTQQKLDGKGNIYMAGKITLYAKERSFNSVPNYTLMHFEQEKSAIIRFENMEVIRTQTDRFERLLIAGHVQNIEILKQVFGTLQSGCIAVIFCQF